jgi:hypothetical protein
LVLFFSLLCFWVCFVFAHLRVLKRSGPLPLIAQFISGWSPQILRPLYDVVGATTRTRKMS